MRRKGALGVLACMVLLASGAAIAAPQHFHGDRYAKLAKVSLDEARATAMKARPGTITDQELENEKGGTGLRYSFDIKAAGGLYEVGVDARTGAVLENSKQGPHPD